MAFGPTSRLGIGLFEDTDPIYLWPSRSNEEVETVIRTVYKQVLGNAYVMESDAIQSAFTRVSTDSQAGRCDRQYYSCQLKNRNWGLKIRNWEIISAVLSVQSLIPSLYHLSKLNLGFDQFRRQLLYMKDI